MLRCVVVKIFDDGDASVILLSGFVVHDFSLVIVVVKRACDICGHTWDDDADVIGGVRVVSRDGSQDVRA